MDRSNTMHEREDGQMALSRGPAVHRDGLTADKRAAQIVRLRWGPLASDPDGHALRFREAFLPLHLVSQASVEIERPRPLGRVERFLLRAVLEQGRVELVELSHATGIPSGPLVMFLEKLARAGLLHPLDAGGYGADRARALEAVHCDELPELTTTEVGILFLPRTGDMLALDAERLRAISRFLSNIRPKCRAPLGDSSGRGILDILNEALAAGRVAGLPGHAKRFTSVGRKDEARLSEHCPAYLLSGEIRLGDEDIPGLRGKLSGKSIKGKGVSDEYEEHGLDLSWARGLRTVLAGVARLPIPRHILEESIRAKIHELVLAGPGQLQVAAPIKAVRDRTRGTLLTQPSGLSVRWEAPELPFEVEYAVRFQPAEDQDSLWFELDALIGQYLNGSLDDLGMRDHLRELDHRLREADGIDAIEAAVARLWQLRHYVRAYELRERDIFSYD